MIRQILFLTTIVAAFGQYPQQRAPPPRYRPVSEDYDDDYAPPPRQAPPPRPVLQPNPRPNIVHKPASVHYVNIGLELAGDYKFGYDTGKGDDQSFREETRLPDGTVSGAYGYIDETGKQRIVKYTAGKDGFKVQSDSGVDDAKPAARAVAASAPARPAPAPQQAYRPPPQPAYAPQPAPRPQPQPAPRPQPQPAYRPAPPAEPAYRPAPPAEPAYRPPPQPQPQPQPRPSYRAPPQPAYAPEPEYRPQPRPQVSRSQASRPQPAPRPVDTYEEPDYDYNNDITERRLVPVDTSLFNYNIGTSHGSKN